MCRRATIIADQEYAVVKAAGMGIGQLGVGAFDPAGEVGRHEQVQNAVHAVGCNTLAALLGNEVGDVIGRGRLFKSRQDIENVRAHFCPLLARVDKCGLRRMGKRCAFMFVMMMCCHSLNLGVHGHISKHRVLVGSEDDLRASIRHAFGGLGKGHYGMGHMLRMQVTARHTIQHIR